MSGLDDLQLAQIMRNASQTQRRNCLDALNKAMHEYGIDQSLPRAAAFIAQIAHESGELRWMEEIWGPTEAQDRYEPPGDLAKKLGNTQSGDGRRYKGRGPIQLTGRANYRGFGALLKLDLEAAPEQAATPAVGFRIAGLFWQRNGLNALADAGDFERITRRINGGLNGLPERERFHERAKLVLAGAFPARAPAMAGAARDSEAVEPLARGFESIRPAPPLHEEERQEAPEPGRDDEASAQRAKASENRVLNARPDTLDFRDLMYVPTLIEVPTHVPLNEYLEYAVPILDQGSEGACTGFGLATVANYLLLRRRVIPDRVPVSPRMFYELARRYDEWPGENYSGSSARGAMKGWHKHGVCTQAEYPYQAGRDERAGLTDARTSSALQRPLGAYFRVNHKDLVAMHSAIAEVGILYATCAVHEGWNQVGPDGRIAQSDRITGGHAFAIVAFDDEGFWLQNSWGDQWGRGGFAHLSYDDWLENGSDVWVARLGAPVRLHRLESIAVAHASTAAQSNAFSFADLRPHIVSVGNDGLLKAGGDYGSTPAELAHIFEDDIPRVTAGWERPRVLLYAHGGLVSERAAVQRLAEYRPRLLEGQIYPLAFIWRTDYWSTVSNILTDAMRRRRPEGMLDATLDFMLDRIDDALEPLARELSGKSVWDEMKQNALAASAGQGAAVRVADHLKSLAARLPNLEIHMVAHSAGSILQAPLVGLLRERGLEIASCTLWAPACTVELFDQTYAPALREREIGRLTLFVLSDAAEQDDNCAHLYNKSLLYLVSNAFERRMHIPLFQPGVPILGMQAWHDDALKNSFGELGVEVVVAPNAKPPGSPDASAATHHGDFDDDEPTVLATFGRIAATSAGAASGERRGAAALSPSAAARAGAKRAAPATAEKPPRPAVKASSVGASSALARQPRMFTRSDASLRAQRQRIDLRTR